MGASWQFKPDPAGIGEIARSSMVGKHINAVAAQLARTAASSFPDGEPVVQPYRTDRQAAGASVYGEGAVGEELRNGYLARAVRAAGLDYRSRRRS